jgi:N-hydroxyarylamine O-acetyltransferase
MPVDHDTVAAYLNRVGPVASAAGDAAGLRALHRAHQLAVPFENLSIHLGEPVSLDGPDLIDKIVRRRRGGFCYELNGAFALLLDARDDQDDPAGRFRLADAGAGDIDVLKDGRPQYRIETRERSLADCIPTCWWQQTSPLSHFTRSTICSRLTPGGRVTISGRMLIQTQGGTRTEHRLETDDLLLAAYQDHFGIALSRVPDGPAA